MFHTADSFTVTYIHILYIYILGNATVNAKANIVLRSNMHKMIEPQQLCLM